MLFVVKILAIRGAWFYLALTRRFIVRRSSFAGFAISGGQKDRFQIDFTAALQPRVFDIERGAVISFGRRGLRALG